MCVKLLTDMHLPPDWISGLGSHGWQTVQI